jgi:hypothetical protein
VRLVNGSSQYWTVSYQVQDNLTPLFNADGSASSFGVNSAGSCAPVGGTRQQVAQIMPIFPGNILDCQ